MPGAAPEPPRPACVEDWDDDAQTTLSYTRASANVAVKQSSSALYVDPTRLKHHRDGSDSGYSSKAGTVASASTNGKKPPHLSIDTSLPERERQPYAMTPQARSTARREPSGKSTPTGYVQTPAREVPFRHHQGVCWTCDLYGRHLSDEEHEQVLAAKAPPASPKVSKKSSRANHDADTKLRRTSSTRDARPNMYPPSANQQFYAVHPSYASMGYATPMTPQTPYDASPMVFAYTTPTPVTTTYVGYAGQADYFLPHPSKDERPPNTKRRSATYGEPVIQQFRKEESHAPGKISNNEVRPTIKTHKSTRSVDQEKADRKAMPPPSEIPIQRTEVARRPSIMKSATYNTAIVDHRRSRGTDDYDYKEAKVFARDASPVRETRQPPSAYKHVEPEPALRRPQAQRKSVSYSDPITTTHVASSQPREPESHHPRRNTAPTKPITTHEQKQADAEAYIQRKSKLTSEQLTAEKIAEMKTSSKHTMSSRSETGSALSHRSHQSSSKDSSGRVRSHTSAGQRTSILIDGGIKLDIPKDYMDRTGRPLSMQFGDLSISVGNKDKSKSGSTVTPSSGRSREQRLLEKPPSVNSQASKRGSVVTDGSGHTSSSKGKEKQRDETERLSRRSSHISETRPPVAGSTHHSQRSSRATSSTRASVDHGRSKRQSMDYEQGRFVYGA